ncbi:MAG: ABC transporter ATP-binding protein [Bacillota bacterium]|nr:ABC transporter ATP-binding protein [Bacillota bacterium]
MKEFYQTLKRFMSINQDYIPALRITILFLIINQGLVAYINYTAGNLTDAITAMNFKLFGQCIVILVLMQLFHLLAEYQVNYRVNFLSESFVKRLRLHTYHKITRASMRWLDENKLGDIVSRINGDLNALVDQVNTFMTWQLAGFVTFVVYMTACILISAKLTLIGFGIVPVLAILQFLTGKPIARLGQKRSVAEGEANGLFMDLMGGIGLIKIFRAEKALSAKYDRQVEKTVRANVKSFSLEFIMNPLQLLMGYLPNIIILVVGSRLVIQKEMTLGMLFSYILLSTAALDFVSGLSWQVRNIYNTIGISKRIFEIWDIEEEKSTGTLLEKRDNIPVRFENVSFGYKEDQMVLRDVTFTAWEGENIAIVGASGSGKSTVMKLLAGFYEKDNGSITIFGNDLDAWDKEKLREHMSYVGQDTYLFPGSIYDNVAMGNKDAQRQQVLEVIEAVGLDKLDLFSPVGERGVLLSGGQKQRVAVARALLKNADILLMDEPTAALDTESEYYVKQAVEKFAVGKTCITIAHRLSTIYNADRILCMENGRIAESGNHEELLSRDGIYRSLYLKQETGCV